MIEVYVATVLVGCALILASLLRDRDR